MEKRVQSGLCFGNRLVVREQRRANSLQGVAVIIEELKRSQEGFELCAQVEATGQRSRGVRIFDWIMVRVLKVLRYS